MLLVCSVILMVSSWLYLLLMMGLLFLKLELKKILWKLNIVIFLFFERECWVIEFNLGNILFYVFVFFGIINLLMLLKDINLDM